MNKHMNYNDDMSENIKDIEILLVELKRIDESCMKLAKKLTTHVLPDRKQKLLVVHTLEIERDNFYRKIFNMGASVEEKLMQPKERRKTFKLVGKEDNEEL